MLQCSYRHHLVELCCRRWTAVSVHSSKVQRVTATLVGVGQGAPEALAAGTVQALAGHRFTCRLCYQQDELYGIRCLCSDAKHGHRWSAA